MNLFKWISNAYQYGGIYEVMRKAVFWAIYKVSNIRTIRYVKGAEKEYGIYTGEAREPKVIVSLTSFPKRFGLIGLTLKSLILQNVKPDKIIVYFANDTKPEDLTVEMREYEKYGVEYRFDSEKNLKSHTKYYYAMQDFPEAIIVTADDDKVYPKNWLKSLLGSYQKYPDAISARRVHLMRLDENGNLAPYNHWIDQYRGLLEPSVALFQTGVGGCLYPPHCLDERTFDAAAIVNLCLNADDVWLKFMAHLHHTKVVWVKNWEVAVAGTANDSIDALSAENVTKGKNDIFIQNLIKAYNIDPRSFFTWGGVTHTTPDRVIVIILLPYILSDSGRAKGV